MNDDLMSTIAAALRIPVHATLESGGVMDQIFEAVAGDDDEYLDLIDAVLGHTTGGYGPLQRILASGGSVWTVQADGNGLERRVSAAAGSALVLATSAGGAVSDELLEAWSKVYGRSPNPSDAWDHAIKALEDLLIPLVVPNMAKPNLGSVAGEIRAHPEKWDFGLPANASRSNGETLEGLLRHVWPNPDRHGGAGKRPPTQAEAEAAVQAAVFIVELCRGLCRANMQTQGSARAATVVYRPLG